MRILIAEDDRGTARSLSGLTTSWGYEAVVASDGESALKLISEQLAPQIVLLDWMLPGMDGPEVCRRIRALARTTPSYLILLTSKSARADVVEGLNAGADEYLVKPFDIDELRARMNAGVRILELQERLAVQVRELEEALANIRKLTGLLPICAYCKSIRDDSNYWHRVEEYVSEHADVTFSHGICPNCLPKLAEELESTPEGGLK
ncbi:MAG TPA: response regulator transcription factor [Vicinamibacterales bacterium]|nr:response regulator transcription factor [Vicinamibacterales bacterium]